MNKKITILLITSLLIILLSGCGSTNIEQSIPSESANQSEQSINNENTSLLIYSGAGLSKPVEDIGATFKEKTGIDVTFVFGGSAQLNSQILLTKKGDIYLPGDIGELKPLTEKELILDSKQVVYHIPVLVVAKGNPKGIHSLADLQKKDIKVALGDSEANPIGKLANKLLDKNGLLSEVEENIVVRTSTVNELVLYVSENQADVAIIWEENYHHAEKKLEIVDTPELKDFIKTVPVALLQLSEEKEAAQKFYDFITDTEATSIWEKWGYQPVKVD